MLVFGTRHVEHIWAKIGHVKTYESNKVKRLGVTIGVKLKFVKNLKSYCKYLLQKQSKTKFIKRLAGLFTFDRNRILLKIFFQCHIFSSVVLWFGCFVAKEVITELIKYMDEL